jgi:hypothetical protein
LRKSPLRRFNSSDSQRVDSIIEELSRGGHGRGTRASQVAVRVRKPERFFDYRTDRKQVFVNGVTQRPRNDALSARGASRNSL